MIKEQIKAIIKQYADKGKKMHSEAINSRGSRYNAGFWDGYECCAKGLLRELEDMQEECMYSKDNYTDKERKALCEGCEEECRFNKKEDSVNNGLDLGCGVIWKDEEPVSEDLPHIRHRDTLDEFAYQCAYDLSNDWAKETPEWKDVKTACKLGANWQKEHLWKPADGDDLPEYDREVIALLDNGKVVFAHRPPEYWDGKDIVTGKVTRNYPKTYDKGGWNIPNVKWWLDVYKLPNVEE